MLRLAAVSLAGAVGTALRYLVGLWATAAFGPMFPVGTLIVNVVGSFLMTFVAEIALTTSLISPTARAVLTTGFMGGLTTYSAFNYETFGMFRATQWGLGALNLVGTVAGCLLAGMLGLFAARMLIAR